MKDKLKVGDKNALFCAPTLDYFFKKIIYFTKDSLITRSDNRFSYKVLALKSGVEEFRAPETLDSNTI